MSSIGFDLASTVTADVQESNCTRSSAGRMLITNLDNDVSYFFLQPEAVVREVWYYNIHVVNITCQYIVPVCDNTAEHNLYWSKNCLR